jgi:type I restriction enzyme M protein
MKLTLQQLEAHLWGAANILRGKTAGQGYKNYILSLMFYKRLCDQWECEADDAIAEQERQQRRAFSEQEKAVFRKRGEHRFQIPDGSRWGDVKAASTNLGEVLTKGMRAVANANDELRGVFTVGWNQPAPDGSGKPLIPNEAVHALVQHFDEHDLSNRSVPSDVLGRAYEYLIKQFADETSSSSSPTTRARRRVSSSPRRRSWTRSCAFSSRAPATRSTTRPPARAACWCMRPTSSASRASTRPARATSRRR